MDHYIHDTVTQTEYVHDTTVVTEYVHDTTIVTLHDTTTVTEYITIHDTTTVTEYVTEYIHDTTTVTEYVTEYVHDTTTVTEYVTEYIHDTVTVTEYVTEYVYDTVTVSSVDTIYVTDTIVPCAKAYTYIYATIHEGETYTDHGFSVSEAGTYVQHLLTAEGCDSTVTLYLQTAVGIDEVAGTRMINIYPNPATRTGAASVTIEGATADVTVVDAQGRVIRRLNGNSEVKTLDVRNLSAGAYYIVSGNTARKLVVE